MQLLQYYQPCLEQYRHLLGIPGEKGICKPTPEEHAKKQYYVYDNHGQRIIQGINHKPGTPPDTVTVFLYKSSSPHQSQLVWCEASRQMSNQLYYQLIHVFYIDNLLLMRALQTAEEIHHKNFLLYNGNCTIYSARQQELIGVQRQLTSLETEFSEMTASYEQQHAYARQASLDQKLAETTLQTVEMQTTVYRSQLTVEDDECFKLAQEFEALQRESEHLTQESSILQNQLQTEEIEHQLVIEKQKSDHLKKRAAVVESIQAITSLQQLKLISSPTQPEF